MGRDVLLVRALHFVCVPGRIISQRSLRRRKVHDARQADEVDRPDESQAARDAGWPPRADQIARQKIARPRLRFARATGASGNFLEPAHPAAQAKRWNALYFQGESRRPRELRSNHWRTCAERARRDFARADEWRGARDERETNHFGAVRLGGAFPLIRPAGTFSPTGE